MLRLFYLALTSICGINAVPQLGETRRGLSLSANLDVIFDSADSLEKLSSPTQVEIAGRKLQVQIHASMRRRMQTDGSASITVAFTVLCDTDCSTVSESVNSNALGAAQAFIDAVNVLGATQGFGTVVTSSAADVAASVVAPEIVTITLPPPPAPAPPPPPAPAPPPPPAPSGPTLAVSAGPYTAGSPIHITFTGATNPTDWIGVYQDGASLDSYSDWLYHHGSQDNSGALIESGNVQIIIPTSGNWFIAFLGDNGFEEIAARIQIEVEAAADPCAAGGGADGTPCGGLSDGETCHAGVCETITWTREENRQCASFLPANIELRTLAAAQTACEAEETCGGVTDYWCNGMFEGYGVDYYALCDGWAYVAHDNPPVCLWPSPTPPPPPTDLCADVTCSSSNPCATAGECSPVTGVCGVETPVVDGTACDTGDGDPANDSCHAGVCESISWARLSNRQCASFLPDDTSLNTLALAEAACSANPRCGGVTDLYCNGMFSSDDHFGLCDGWETVDASDTSTFGYPLCIFPRVGQTHEIDWVIPSDGINPISPLLVEVGDVLHFTWSGNHNVVLMDEDTCEGVGSRTVLDASGDYSTQIISPGAQVYACAVGQHCAQGQKLVVNAVWPDVTPGECSVNDYEIEDYVVWSSVGHDIDHMQGTAAECMAACCDAVRPGHANHPPAPCVGFGRRKAAALDQVSDCWLKTYAVEADRVYNNPTYEFFENTQRHFATNPVAHPCEEDGMTMNAVYPITFSYPSRDYGNTEACSYNLYCDDDGEVPVLNINALSLSTGDSLIVYDGDSTSTVALEQFTSSSVPISGIEASGPHMLVQLQQDGSGDNDGFTARFSCAPPSPPPPAVVPVMIIKGVLDLQTPQRGSSGKGIQLLAVTDVPNLALFALGVANNGGGTDGIEVENLPSLSLSAGQSFWAVHRQAVEKDGLNPWALYFGADTVFAVGNNNIDYHIDTDISQNGDDAVELFYSGSVVDLYGDIDVDGTGEPWDYRDAWAYRLDSVTAPSVSFSIEEWQVASRDCSDTSTTNCDSECGPYPAFPCSPPPPPPNCVPALDPTDGSTVGTICAVIELRSEDGPAGTDTYILKAALSDELASIFAIFGDVDNPLLLPEAWNSVLPAQLDEDGFAGPPPADIPSTLPGADMVMFDSYLCLGSTLSDDTTAVPGNGQPGGPLGLPWAVDDDGMGTPISPTTYGSNGASISTYPTCYDGLAGCTTAGAINPSTVKDSDGNVVVGQLTVAEGTSVSATLSFQGKVGGGGSDARVWALYQARSLEFQM